MNLNAYDSVTPNFTTTWVVPNNRKLYSYTIPFHRYYTFLKRYNKNDKFYDFYIAFSNNQTKDKIWFNTYRTNSNAIKVDLKPIWNITNFYKLQYPQEIDIQLEDKSEDGAIYYFNI